LAAEAAGPLPALPCFAASEEFFVLLLLLLLEEKFRGEGKRKE
jgi:hypothetical protein